MGEVESDVSPTKKRKSKFEAEGSEVSPTKKRKSKSEGELSEVSPTKERKPKSEAEDSEVNPEKKAKTFCCRTFRQELKGSEALKSLKRFAQAAKNSEDVIFEYLGCGGSLNEVLSLIDPTATGDLTTALAVFEVVHLILLRFQSSDSKHHQKCIEGARFILRSHLPLIKAMLSMNVTKQKKVALKLLTAIATLDSTFANEIINVVALSPGLIGDLIKPSAEKESVRKCFILFLLSFLIEGNVVVLKNLLEKKGFLSSIIPGLKFDDADTVNLTLSLLEEKILKNVKITKTLKLKLFNTPIIKSLFDLFDWKGPQGVKQLVVPEKKKNKVKLSEVNEKEKEVVTDSVHSFLLLLCCSKKFGVAFADKLLTTSNQLSNELLFTVLEGVSDPLKNEKLADVVLKTLSSCPDLITPVLHKFEPSFQPRSSEKWFKAIEFAENLIKEVDAISLVKKEEEIPSIKRIVKIGQTLCAPVAFLRVIKTGSESSQPLQIQLRCLKFLSTLWREMEKLFASQNFGGDLRKPLRHHFFKFVPEVEDLIQLWDTLCKTENVSFSFLQDKKSSFLSTILDVLRIRIECSEEEINLLGLSADLLRHVEEIRETMTLEEFDDIEVKIVRFMEWDLESLMSNTELFERSLLILLRSPDDTSLSYLSRILSNLDVFQRNKPEIDVWILCYMSLSKQSRAFVADFFVESLRRCFSARDEMTKLLMSYIPESSILTEENDTSQQSLTNLIIACVEVLKSHLDNSNKEQTTAFQHFVNDVVIHLQNFYAVDVHLHDRLKGFKKIITKPVLNYLKNFKDNIIESVNSDIFPCPLELSLASWLLNDEDSRKFETIIDTTTVSLLKRQSLFRIVVGYLNVKIKNENWSENDAGKFSEALSVLLKTDESESEEEEKLLSYDFNNESVYRRQCLSCLLSNNHLLDNFEIFRKRQNTPRAIAFNVLIENEIFKNSSVKKKLTEPWKGKFLKQLMSKLKKQQRLKGCCGLEKVLDFFDYELSDVTDVIDMFTTVSDLDLFVEEDSPSLWVTILTKFYALHCRWEELSEESFKKLCLIMKHLCEKHINNVEEMDGCFVYLLRSHPRHLLYIDNDFLQVTLQRTNTTSTTHTLGKLLLNDPDKVKRFLQILTEDIETVQDSQLIFSLLSILVVKDDALLQTFKKTGWKSSKINPKTTPKIYKALEVVYKKFQKNIHKAITGEKEELIFNNLNITREMLKLFFGDKQMKKVKNGLKEGKFEPVLMFDAVGKVEDKESIENYMEGLLTMFCRLIKNSKDGDGDWLNYCSIVSELVQKNSSWENVVESPAWKEFPKLALGYCFTSGSNPPLLKILRLLVEIFYKEGSKDCALFFQMAISHSQFLKIILSNGVLKNELVELFYCLIKRSPSEMSPKHIPILLASYSASLSPCDVTLLRVLQLYEKSNVKMTDYEPLVWGETAVSHYSIGTGRGLSLWQRFNMRNVLDLLDGQRMETSLREFPLKRNLEVNKVPAEYDSVIYDPAFILPLFGNLLSPGSVVFCLPFIYKGGLAYTVRALSSESEDIRALAAFVLARFYNHLELSQNLKQKLVWMHFINCFRYGIENLSEKPLPNIATLFFARMTLELSRHPAEMYLPLQNFLLAKSYFAFDVVPEFLVLFHSSEVSYWKHRAWLLEVMRDGTKTASDIKIIFRTMALKVFLSFFHSQLCDNETKKLTLQVVERMLRINKSILLISEYGLLNWITSIDDESYPPILQDLLILLSTTVKVILKNIKENKSSHSDSSHVVQILNFAVKLLPFLKAEKSVEVFQIYLKLVLKCLIFFAEGEKTEWFRFNKNRIFDIIESGRVILGDDNDCGKYCNLPFYFREFNDSTDEVGRDLKDSVFMFSLLVNSVQKIKSPK